MLKYRIINCENSIKSVEVTGHANFADYGKDIVCAAVTTAITMTVNQLEIFNQLINIEYEMSEGKFELNVINNNEVIQNILKNLENALIDLNDQFPKNIKNL